jgi:2,3-bisphosphoglycerate-dependent phosphoglycerate mutase
MLPYWFDSIVPDLLHHQCVLVSAHGNSLRALVKHLEGLTDEEVVDLNLPTGVPRVYELDSNYRPTSSRYLGDPDEIAATVLYLASPAGAFVTGKVMEVDGGTERPVLDLGLPDLS